VVVFAAAVFVLQAAVAQSAQLAVPSAWGLAPVRGVQQAVPYAERDDQLAAQSVPCASLAAQSGASLADRQAAHLVALPADPLVVHSAPYELLAVHLVPCELLAVRSVALPADPQAVHLALDALLAAHSVLCALPAVRSDVLPCGPLPDCLAVRLAADHW